MVLFLLFWSFFTFIIIIMTPQGLMQEPLIQAASFLTHTDNSQNFACIEFFFLLYNTWQGNIMLCNILTSIYVTVSLPFPSNCSLIISAPHAALQYWGLSISVIARATFTQEELP